MRDNARGSPGFPAETCPCGGAKGGPRDLFGETLSELQTSKAL